MYVYVYELSHLLHKFYEFFYKVYDKFFFNFQYFSH